MGRMRAWIIGMIIACMTAFQYLTRFPLPVKIVYREANNRNSLIFYPFVGATIGLLIMLAGTGLREWLPGYPAAVLLLILWLAVTGAAPLIGLINMADGILHQASRERMLERMKEQQSGAIGIIVCISSMLLKLSFIMELVDGSWRFAAAYFFCAPIWSRWFMAVAIYHWPQKTIGAFDHSSYFYKVRLKHIICTTLLSFLLTIGALWIFGFSGYHLFVYSIGFPVAACALGWGLAGYLFRKLGGLTSAAYGALNEIIEVFLLFWALVLWN